MAHDYTMDPADYEMTGVLAKVSGTVRTGGTGEIIFEQEGRAKRARPVVKNSRNSSVAKK